MSLNGFVWFQTVTLKSESDIIVNTDSTMDIMTNMESTDLPQKIEALLGLLTQSVHNKTVLGIYLNAFKQML